MHFSTSFFGQCAVTIMTLTTPMLALANPSPVEDAAAPAVTSGVVYNASYDNISTLTNPYKGLNYTNFQLAQAQKPFLTPHSKPNMIMSTDSYPMMKITSTYGEFVEIKSLYMACLSCVGSGCAGGIDPYPCNVTMVGVFPAFSEVAIESHVLQYTPKSYENQTLQFFDAPGKGNYLIQGQDIYLFLTSGISYTQVYIDNIVYDFVD